MPAGGQAEPVLLGLRRTSPSGLVDAGADGTGPVQPLLPARPRLDTSSGDARAVVVHVSEELRLPLRWLGLLYDRVDARPGGDDRRPLRCGRGQGAAGRRRRGDDDLGPARSTAPATSPRSSGSCARGPTPSASAASSSSAGPPPADATPTRRPSSGPTTSRGSSASPTPSAPTAGDAEVVPHHDPGVAAGHRTVGSRQRTVRGTGRDPVSRRQRSCRTGQASELQANAALWTAWATASRVGCRTRRCWMSPAATGGGRRRRRTTANAGRPPDR